MRGEALARSNSALETEYAERERVQEQLIHAMKVEATGRLASGVAHDFIPLLGLILGHAARARHSDDPAVLKQALEDTESFFWTFCDDYIELVKDRAHGGRTPEGAASARAAVPPPLADAIHISVPSAPPELPWTSLLPPPGPECR